jgi:hypothetical protein
MCFVLQKFTPKINFTPKEQVKQAPAERAREREKNKKCREHFGHFGTQFI